MNQSEIPYSQMYAVLCGAASEAIDLIVADRKIEAALKLQAALDAAEELGIDSDGCGSEENEEPP